MRLFRRDFNTSNFGPFSTMTKGGAPTLVFLRFHRHLHSLKHFVVVQSLSHVWLFATPWTVALQVPYPPVSLGVCSNSCPLRWWCHLTISSSVVSFSFCLQSFSASRSFPGSQQFASGGQSIGASESISPSNEYSGLISFRIDWFDLPAVQGTLKSLLRLTQPLVLGHN